MNFKAGFKSEYSYLAGSLAKSMTPRYFKLVADPSLRLSTPSSSKNVFSPSAMSGVGHRECRGFYWGSLDSDCLTIERFLDLRDWGALKVISGLWLWMGRSWAGCGTCGGAWVGWSAGVGACGLVGVWTGASAGLGGAVGAFSAWAGGCTTLRIPQE